MNNNADDINLIETKRNSLHVLQERGKRSGLVINKAKTQAMVFGTDNIDDPIQVVDCSSSHNLHTSALCSHTIMNVHGTLTTQIGKAKAVTKSKENVWKSKNIKQRRETAYKPIGTDNIVLYGFETWTYNKVITDQIQTTDI